MAGQERDEESGVPLTSVVTHGGPLSDLPEAQRKDVMMTASNDHHVQKKRAQLEPIHLPGQNITEVEVVKDGEDVTVPVFPDDVKDLPEGEPLPKPVTLHASKEAAEDAEARAALAADALNRWGILGEGTDKTSENKEEDDEGDNDDVDRSASKLRPWETHCMRFWMLTVSLVLVAAGVLLQVLNDSPENKVAFRWCYFIAGIYPAMLASAKFVNYVLHTMEMMFYKEFLAHFESLRAAGTRSLSLAVIVIWHLCMFTWGWCFGDYAGVCQDPAYVKSSQVTLRIVLCLCVGSLATLLAAVATKFMSNSFYKSTGFKKLQAALDKEFRLKVLSKPRPRERKGWMGNLPTSTQGKKPVTKSEAARSAASPEISAVNQTDDANGGTGTAVSSRQPSISMPSTGYRSSDDLAGLDDHIELRLKLEGNHLNLDLLAAEDANEQTEFSDEEMERLRNKVVVKTYSSLIDQHKTQTAEEIKKQMKHVQKFGKALFNNVRGSDASRKFVTLGDVRDFYPDDREGRAQALESFNMFAINPYEQVTKEKVVDSVLEIYKQRSNIAASLGNTESMMNSLHNGLAGGLHFLFIGLYLIIWDVDVVQGFSTFSATVLALSFVFGNSIRNTFESMLFLFVQHPYDVGDRIEIDGTLYTVVKTSLLYTYFTAADGKHVTISNPSISQKAIYNLSRTPSHLEFVNIPVDVDVSEDLRSALTDRLRTHIQDNSNDLDPEVLGVSFTGMLPNMKVNVFIVWSYLMTPDDFLRKRNTRDGVLAVVKQVLIEYKQHGALYSYTHQIGSPGGDVGGSRAQGNDGDANLWAATAIALLEDEDNNK